VPPSAATAMPNTHAHAPASDIALLPSAQTTAFFTRKMVLPALTVESVVFSTFFLAFSMVPITFLVEL